MRRVVLFKSESEEYQRAFTESNYEAVFVEPLQFEALNLEDLKSKLDSDAYIGLILTSPRAVEAVARCWSPDRLVAWSQKKVYTVGEVSSRQILALLGLHALGASTGNAENLAKLITSENPENSHFLFPCGNLRSETIVEVLNSKLMKVDALTVYETKENENLKTSLIELNDSGALCAMVFFSPSGCEYIHRQLQTFNNDLLVLPHFAIGNSTAHKILNLGIEIAGVAAKPKADSVVQSVQNYFTNKSQC